MLFCFWPKFILSRSLATKLVRITQDIKKREAEGDHPGTRSPLLFLQNLFLNLENFRTSQAGCRDRGIH